MRDPHAPRGGDRDAVAAWRQWMGTDEAKARYKLRAATAETVNADLNHHRGLSQVLVRGLEKALSAVSLFVVTYDVLRAIALGA